MKPPVGIAIALLVVAWPAGARAEDGTPSQPSSAAVPTAPTAVDPVPVIPVSPLATALTPHLDPGSPGVAQESQLRWYGGPILLADAAAFALGFLVLQGTGTEPLAILPLASYFVAPVVVHVRNGHSERGAVSLLLRLGLPLVGFAIGFKAGSVAASDGCGFFGCGLEYAADGFLLGGLGAVVADQFLAWDRVPAR